MKEIVQKKLPIRLTISANISAKRNDDSTVASCQQAKAKVYFDQCHTAGGI